MAIDEKVEYGETQRLFKNALSITGTGRSDQFKEVFRGLLLGEPFLLQYIKPVRDQEILVIDGLNGVVLISRLGNSSYEAGCQIPNGYTGTKPQFMADVDKVLGEYLASEERI